MKTTRLLRVLSLLGFLLLMAPFYDACDGHLVKQVEATDAASVDTTAVKVDSTKIDSIEIEKTKVDTIENPIVEKASILQKIYDVVVDEESLNAFDFAKPMITESFKETSKEIIRVFAKKDWYKNLFVVISLIFNFIILISFSMLVLSFTKKHKFFNKLALINSNLTLITFLYIVFLENSFEHWSQIKWGYYAFIITNLLIFYYSKPNKIQT